jgi:chromate transporter
VTYWHLFVAFFVPNIVGYGGGPAIIPLIEAEVVERYGWMSSQQFAETLALGNTLPSPIATKMAGYVGYEVAGATGAAVAVLATVVPSLLLMLGALGVLYRHRDSPRVIALMMAALSLEFLAVSLDGPGPVHTLIIAAIAAIALIRFQLHPVFVVLFALAYGGILLS